MNGADFRAKRLAMKLTQRTISRWFGVSEQTVRRWENGNSAVVGAAQILMAILYAEQVNKSPRALYDWLHQNR